MPNGIAALVPSHFAMISQTGAHNLFNF